MELNSGRLNWGVFFIVLGAVPLAFHQGAVTEANLSSAWQLWPLVLVGIGLGLILSRTAAYFVGGLVVAACLGLVFGSLITVGPNIGCGRHDGNSSTITRDGSFDGPGNVKLELQCGSATVTASADNQWHVRASNSSGVDPDVRVTANSLSVSSRRDRDWFSQRGDDSWDIALPAQQTSLSVSVDAGDVHLGLSGVTVDSLSLSLNAGSMKTDLTNAHVNRLTVSTNVGSSSLILDAGSNVSGSISTNVGSMNLCYPNQLGVRLRVSESLGSGNYSAAGMVRAGDAWQTPGYDTATSKADFSVSTSVGSLTLNPAGGCK